MRFLRIPLAAALLLAAALAAGGWAQNADTAKDPKDTKPKPATTILRTECERESATYKVGEPAVFLLASTTGGEVDYTFTLDELKLVKEGKIRVTPGQTFKIEHASETPGFLRLTLKHDGASASAVAAIDPTKITATAKAPGDFDEFWKAQCDELAKVRIDQVVEPWVTESTPAVTVYRINLASIDERRVYGWIAVPKGEGPFPAILTVPYAGVYGIKPDLYHANLGAVAMNIIVHDFPVNHPAEFYKGQAESELKDYNRIGWDDRDKSYYRYAILAGVRAIDYLAQRKDVDPKQIAVTGVSQGGGLALCVSGLDDRVGFVAPNVAGLCDLNARSQGRIDGWPHWLAYAPANLKEKIETTSQYFDAVNFARKFKGKSLHGVGFLDTVCPPSTVYAAFNQHPEPKVMIDSPKFGHNTDPRWFKAREAFWKENLALKPPPQPAPPVVKKK